MTNPKEVVQIVGRALAVAWLLAATAAGASVFPETAENRGALEANREEAERTAERAETLTRAAAGLASENGVASGSLVWPLLDFAVDPTASGDHRQRAVRLLGQALSHPSPSVARQAERAFEALRAFESRSEDRVESPSDENTRRRMRQRTNLEATMEHLSDTGAAHREALASTFAMLAIAQPGIAPGIEEFAFWLRRDLDAEVARWGEVLVAWLEDRAPDPALVPPYRPSLERLRRDREREDSWRAKARDPDPRKRLDALRQLAELALSDERQGDPDLLAVFTAALDDSDSRVSSYARFMLAGLAGNRPALGMVFSRGESLP